MPETSMNEDSKLRLFDDYVRRPGKTSVCPIAYFCPFKMQPEDTLGERISLSNSGHHFAAFSGRPDISHRCSPPKI
jgi:hypothetical protein